jgi:hypothetical protein
MVKHHPQLIPLLAWLFFLAAALPITLSIFLLHGIGIGREQGQLRVSDQIRGAPAEVLIYLSDELRPPWVPKAAIDPKGMQLRGRGGDFRAGEDVARHEPSRLLVRMARAQAVHKCAAANCTAEVRGCQASPSCNVRWATCVQDSCSLSKANIVEPVRCVAGCMRGEALFDTVHECLENKCTSRQASRTRDRGRISDLVFD